MKNSNRKLLLSLLGIVVAAPFVIIALVVGLRATALANSPQGDLLVVVLALASVVASLGEGRIGMRRASAPVLSKGVEGDCESDLRGMSTLTHGF